MRALSSVAPARLNEIQSFGRGASHNKMYVVYVLRDLSGKMYKGMTNDLARRLREHRAGGTRTTSLMEKFEVAYQEECATFEEEEERVIFEVGSRQKIFKK